MKKSKSDTAEKVFYIITFTIMTLIVLGLLGYLIYLDFYISKSAFSLIWVALLPIFGLIANKLFEHFTGNKGYGANWVEDARKGKGIVKQNKRRMRKILTTFIECVMFALLLARFVVLFPLNKVFAIIGITCSAIGFISYFAIGVIPTE